MRDIKGYEKLYAVTSCGRVWSYRSKRFLKLIPAKDGYRKVNLYDKDGKMRTFQVHRLVAQAFLPNPDDLPEINHKDEVKDHNWLFNLEWCDKVYNANYGTRTERVVCKTRKTVYCIELDKIYRGTLIASLETGARRDSIINACNGKQKTAGGYHWRYIGKECAAS